MFPKVGNTPSCPLEPPTSVACLKGRRTQLPYPGAISRSVLCLAGAGREAQQTTFWGTGPLEGRRQQPTLTPRSKRHTSCKDGVWIPPSHLGLNPDPSFCPEGGGGSLGTPQWKHLSSPKDALGRDLLVSRPSRRWSNLTMVTVMELWLPPWDSPHQRRNYFLRSKNFLACPC